MLDEIDEKLERLRFQRNGHDRSRDDLRRRSEPNVTERVRGFELRHRPRLTRRTQTILFCLANGCQVTHGFEPQRASGRVLRQRPTMNLPRTADVDGRWSSGLPIRLQAHGRSSGARIPVQREILESWALSVTGWLTART